MVPRRIKEILSMRGRGSSPTDVILVAVGAGPCACPAGQPPGGLPLQYFLNLSLWRQDAGEMDNAHALGKILSVLFDHLLLELAAGSRDERTIIHPFRR